MNLLPKRKRLTVRRALAQGFASAFTLVALGTATVAPGLFKDPPVAIPHTTEESPADKGAALIEKHGCWTGEAPDPTVIPGHAIVTLPGQEARRVPSAVGFDIWRGPDDEPGTGDERPGISHAFCP